MRIRQVLVGTAAVASMFAVSATPAFAAGSGYAPPSSSGSGATNAGFTTVLSAQTVSTTGGTLKGASGQSNATVTIPSGAFSTPVQVTLTEGNQTTLTGDVPSGDSLLTAFGVNFSGATPQKPITLTITDSGIPTNAEVFKVTASGLQQMKAVVKNGTVTVTFQNDPDFVVVKPKSGYVSQATSPVTGIPMWNTLGEGAGVALLGAAMITLSMRRKQSN